MHCSLSLIVLSLQLSQAKLYKLSQSAVSLYKILVVFTIGCKGGGINGIRLRLCIVYTCISTATPLSEAAVTTLQLIKFLIACGIACGSKVSLTGWGELGGVPELMCTVWLLDALVQQSKYQA